MRKSFDLCKFFFFFLQAQYCGVSELQAIKDDLDVEAIKDDLGDDLSIGRSVCQHF